jgi:hypothetical protein
MVILRCLAGCGFRAAHSRLDSDHLVYRHVFTGPTSPPIHLPAGRYTAFGGVTPEGCAWPALSVFKQSGARAVPENISVVQTDFPWGDYTFALDHPSTTTACVWKLEIVMNRPAAGTSWPPVFPVQSPHTIRLAGVDSGVVAVPAAGNYIVAVASPKTAETARRQ